jgi:hypothetical protein
MVNSRGASVARGGLRSAPVRISDDSFSGVRPGDDVAQRVARRRPVRKWQKLRGYLAHALRDSVLCYGQVGPDNIKKFIVRS